ncbi:MAG TPA: serine/threonine-protein kinase [Kofleriaceae bacterium]|nr:serine/threonine-protein kinase [Kofleriaceae bacterium]
MPAEGGIRFGSYVLLRRIARGGMAEVFLAQQRGLEGFDRRVAVKRILPHLLDSPDFVRMFLGEAKLAAQLTHPNVVHIYDFGKVESDYFIAMEFVDGIHAGQVFKRGETEGADRLPATLVARIGADAANALHYAHDLRGANGKPLGLVHRDVSPANIMISFDGVVKLCDFGIAKAAALSDQLTNPGQVKGKYAYMSPEQTIGAQLDGRSDVFSLAIVLWELLTGRFIVSRGDAVEAMRAIRDGRLEPLAKAAPSVPPALAHAITSALETQRDKRPTAAQFAESLEAFIKSSPELGNAMQLAAWIRARFQREGTGQVPALTARPDAATMAAPAGTVASPGTIASPGTVIASGTQGPITPPKAAPSKLADRVLEDRTGSFGGDLDDETAVTVKRADPVYGDTTEEDASRRAADEATLRERASWQPQPGERSLAVTTPRDRPITAGPPPAAPLPASGPRPRITPGPGDPRRRPGTVAPADRTRRRRMRAVLAIVGLAGLALASFAIALAASGSGGGARAPAAAADAAPAAIVPAPVRDAAPIAIAAPADAPLVAPPPAVPMAWLDVRTTPTGATIKLGDQTRVAPAQLYIPAGHVTVTAQLAGYEDEVREIDLDPEVHHEIEIAFGRKQPTKEPSRPHPPALGKLTVRTTPYSDVYEGGKLIGTTPFAERALPAGKHTLVFKNPQHGTIEKKITISAGVETRLSFALP